MQFIRASGQNMYVWHSVKEMFKNIQRKNVQSCSGIVLYQARIKKQCLFQQKQNFEKLSSTVPDRDVFQCCLMLSLIYSQLNEVRCSFLSDSIPLFIHYTIYLKFESDRCQRCHQWLTEPHSWKLLVKKK